jgi:hypothetical protein
MYDVIYEVEIALCNINKDTLQLYEIHKKCRWPVWNCKRL